MEGGGEESFLALEWTLLRDSEEICFEGGGGDR